MKREATFLDAVVVLRDGPSQQVFKGRLGQHCPVKLPQHPPVEASIPCCLYDISCNTHDVTVLVIMMITFMHQPGWTTESPDDMSLLGMSLSGAGIRSSGLCVALSCVGGQRPVR